MIPVVLSSTILIAMVFQTITFFEVSSGDKRHVHRSLETSYSYSHNYVVYHSIDDVRGLSLFQETGHYSYRNNVVFSFGENGRGGYRSLDTSHSSSRNHGARVDVSGRGGDSYHTRNYSSHNLGGRGRLWILKIYYFPVDNNVHEYYRLQYNGHGDDRVDLSDNNG